jgi:hypothetical protein
MPFVFRADDGLTGSSLEKYLDSAAWPTTVVDAGGK